MTTKGLFARTVSWRLNVVRIIASLVLLASCRSALGQSWIPLFDGLSLSGWQQPNGQPPGEGWEVVDGMLHLRGGRPRGHNLVTDREFRDFELIFEWKISRRGNNGVKYRVNQFGGRTLGLEYQLIDDVNYDGLRPKQKAAALYDLYEPQRPTLLRPVGEFNRARILVCGNVIEHWLNGRRVLTAVVGGEEWQRRLEASKFDDVDGFGTTATGRIMLTDHNDEVWYRNIFVREPCVPNRSPSYSTQIMCGNSH